MHVDVPAIIIIGSCNHDYKLHAIIAVSAKPILKQHTLTHTHSTGRPGTNATTIFQIHPHNFACRQMEISNTHSHTHIHQTQTYNLIKQPFQQTIPLRHTHTHTHTLSLFLSLSFALSFKHTHTPSSSSFQLRKD